MEMRCCADLSLRFFCSRSFLPEISEPIRSICKRSYFEVRLFQDRLEIWNPGSLPGTLTMDSLRQDHPSVPYNPLLAESLYLARYIERVGSGTQTMIELCREAGLPEPHFEQRGGFFVTTLWRDWLTPEVLGKLTLNERQIAGVAALQTEGRITSGKYQELTGVSRQTATRDLEDLVKKKIFEQRGERRGAYYIKAKEMPRL